mgnify:FL=1
MGSKLFLLLGNDALFDLRSLTGPVAKVIELSPANNTMANDLDMADTGAVVGEGSLNTDAVAYAANGEGLADAAALHLDDDAFKVLKPLAVAFNDLDVNTHGVADLGLGEVGTKLLFFELSDDV